MIGADPVRILSTFLLTAAMFSPSLVQAAEVKVEGFYQLRTRLFDTLSLDRTTEFSEGLAWNHQHRLWLRPSFFITDEVALKVDVRGLDGVSWGQDRLVVEDATLNPLLGDLFSDTLNPPFSEDGERPSDISLWRAWGEVNTKAGTFRFGRQPLHWGKGIWQNDGLALNTDFGDSADRLSWEHLVKDVWVQLAVDVNAEGLVNATDDTTSFNAAVGYRSETIEGGVNMQYRRSGGPAAEGAFDLFTVDAAFKAELGIVGLDSEFIGRFGGGDLSESVTNVRVQQVGGVLDLNLNLPRLEVGVEAGFATGDGDAADGKFTAFTFDPDYNVGLFMFEQPMPTLRDDVAASGRAEDLALTGRALSNALYLRPRGSYKVIPKGLWLDGYVLTGRVAKVSDAVKAQGRQGYGYEFGLGLRWTGTRHLELAGLAGAYVPGSYQTAYTDEIFVEGFRAPAFGGQLLSRIRF